SSARSRLPHKDTANARRFGMTESDREEIRGQLRACGALPLRRFRGVRFRWLCFRGCDCHMPSFIALHVLSDLAAKHREVRQVPRSRRFDNLFRTVRSLPRVARAILSDLAPIINYLRSRL